MTARLPVLALAAFVVGLALHNVAMASLWDAGLRGGALDAVAAWKEVLLALALGLALWHARRLPLALLADRLALAYALVVVLYALLPQDWLGGDADVRGVALALRHHLAPVGAYALGRLVLVSARDVRRLLLLAAGTAAALAAWGMADVYLVSLQWWRESGVPGWYAQQLELDYGKSLSGLPENWVYNTGDETNPIRRVVSTFLSPLATAYLLVVVLVYLASRRFSWPTAACALAAYAGLLWTHTRAAYLALAGGLLVLAAIRRSGRLAVAALASLAISVVFVKAYAEIGPSTSYTPAELAVLREQGQAAGDVSEDPLSVDESSIASHWRNLRNGIETVIRHPQGHGLGNAGVVAKRTGVEIRAGESTYAEIGVDAGLAGALAFAAWSLAALAAVARRAPWLAGAFAAVLALALQSDVIGIHWLAYCLWAAVGVALGRDPGREPRSD